MRVMFQRRYYTVVAATLRTYADDRDLFCAAQKHDLVDAFGDLFARDNARFSRSRFELACYPAVLVRPRPRGTRRRVVAR